MVYLFLFVLLFSSCVTSTELYNKGTGTSDIRDAISEGQGIQAESAISGARIESGIINAENSADRIEARINELESVIASGETNYTEIDDIFSRVRTRTTQESTVISGTRTTDIPP